MADIGALHHVPAANEAWLQRRPLGVRERTVPIPETLTPVPGYPQKLVVFKIAASRYWQVRCWLGGRTHRRSTQSQSLRVALGFARQFYEQLLAERYAHRLSLQPELPGLQAPVPPPAPVAAPPEPESPTFGELAAQVMGHEQARAARGEYSLGSWQVLRNRMDAHILPRWAQTPVHEVNYRALLDFTQHLSQRFSTATVSQYLVAVRKVLSFAAATDVLDAVPEFPRIRIHTTPRGAFTPSEYWQIIRCARHLRGHCFPGLAEDIRKRYKIRRAEQALPPDLPWAMGFMLHSFIRPSDLKTLKHRHVEVVRSGSLYLRLTLPETKRHGKPIVTLQAAVRIYRQMKQMQQAQGYGAPDDYLFLPHLQDRNYAHWVLNFHFNWVLAETGLKQGPHGQPRSLYSLRHSAITFRLLYGQGIDLLTLARNARTSVDVIQKHYASTVTGEQNIALLQSRRRPELRRP
jgi:hypothetical protein